MISALVSLVWGIVAALFFAFISTRKLNLFTRVTVDVTFGFISLFALYVIEFLLTDGNVLPYVFTLFCLAFFATLSFVFPIKKKENKKRD